MANTKSAKKAARVAVRRKKINTARKDKMRLAVKKIETAIKAGDKAKAKAALQAGQPELHKAAGKGLIKKNTAARKLSRLSAAIKKLPDKK